MGDEFEDLPTQRKKPKVDSYQCAANNCPLRATIFDTMVGPPSHGRCRYHDKVPASKWPVLTRLFRSGPFTKELMEPSLRAIGLAWLEGPQFLSAAQIEAAAERAAIQADGA